MARSRTETAYCQECGAIADVYVKPMSDGRVVERCRNRRCAGSLEHACQPDPSAPAPSERRTPFSQTREWRQLRRVARGEIVQPPSYREVPIPGIALSFMGI